MYLIPSVKKLEYTGGSLEKRCICLNQKSLDTRLMKALTKLPCAADGVPLEISIEPMEPEAYRLTLEKTAVRICAGSAQGAFYGIQTLRQIFQQEEIPCLRIEDKPDFSYRGFYHDVTRGKIPTLETLYRLIDEMAYYKLNSLQLYVEHVYEFEECKKLVEQTGCLTARELQAIDAYCQENFIEFIPSLSTFGHMYEILNQDQYRHLQVLTEYVPEPNFWRERMQHHTIDPLNPESEALVGSLIDQYYPNFKTEYFNICGDETFDLNRQTRHDGDPGTLYVDFIQKIIAHVKSRGKKVMMWADILLKHPQVIPLLPEDTIFLNWRYQADIPEEMIERFTRMGRPQIVCPGTSTWLGLCEIPQIAEPNICRMAEYGFKHGALGVLNTNWGDWGNPGAVETAMYGLVLGAEKSWSVATKPDQDFYDRVNALVYENNRAMEVVMALGNLSVMHKWHDFCKEYFARRYGATGDYKAMDRNTMQVIQYNYEKLRGMLETPWKKDEYRQELLLCAEGICVMTELSAKTAGIPCVRRTDTKQWLAKFREKWLQKNKPSELHKIEEMFLYAEEN